MDAMMPTSPRGYLYLIISAEGPFNDTRFNDLSPFSPSRNFPSLHY